METQSGLGRKTGSIRGILRVLVINSAFLLSAGVFCHTLNAQSTIKNDTAARALRSNHQIADSTANSLSPVTITAFQGKGNGIDIAASVFPLNQEAFEFIDKSSFISTLNTVPGVRLEERSPGSLRLSVRGSLLRSPYGVRGIKFYIDGIPLTDAGGNTYFQSLSPQQIQSAEIVKGPAGSLYGQGTGGAVLFHSPAGFTDSTRNNYTLGYNMGSYGRMSPTASWEHASKNNHTFITASHLYSKGDRAQDTTRRSVISYSSWFRLSNHLQLHLLGFYSDLYYQTPGGITQNQLGTDTTAYPLSIKQHAAIYNRTLLSAATLKSHITRAIDNETSILWSHTNFKNPFTSNYEKRKENNYGGRTVFSAHDNNAARHWQILAGMEWLAGNSRIDNFGNIGGIPDTVQYKDRLNIQRKSFFVQFGLDMDKQSKWHLQAGISANQQKLRYHRLSDPSQLTDETSNTDYLWSPKIGLTYKLLPSVSIYATAAKGFSTPTLAEIHPSDGRFEQHLQAERGWNLEAGIRGQALNGQLAFEGNLYDFRLKKAIVRRVDENDVEYYINAGVTSQKGAELWVQYRLFAQNRLDQFISQLQLSGSYSYQPFRFVDYQVEDNNYDGNPLTGVPKNIFVFTLNIQSKTGLYLHTVLNATSSIPLNDAATVYADRYQLLQAKTGYRFNCHKTGFDLYFGMDNILNQAYSLGNDINAYGGRYFNPAPGRNFFTGIQLSF